MGHSKIPENLYGVFSEKGFRPEEIALLERVSENPALMLTSSQVKAHEQTLLAMCYLATEHSRLRGAKSFADHFAKDAIAALREVVIGLKLSPSQREELLDIPELIPMRNLIFTLLEPQRKSVEHGYYMKHKDTLGSPDDASDDRIAMRSLCEMLFYPQLSEEQINATFYNLYKRRLEADDQQKRRLEHEGRVYSLDAEDDTERPYMDRVAGTVSTPDAAEIDPEVASHVVRMLDGAYPKLPHYTQQLAFLMMHFTHQRMGLPTNKEFGEILGISEKRINIMMGRITDEVKHQQKFLTTRNTSRNSGVRPLEPRGKNETLLIERPLSADLEKLKVRADKWLQKSIEEPVEEVLQKEIRRTGRKANEEPITEEMIEHVRKRLYDLQRNMEKHEEIEHEKKLRLQGSPSNKIYAPTAPVVTESVRLRNLQQPPWVIRHMLRSGKPIPAGTFPSYELPDPNIERTITLDR